MGDRITELLTSWKLTTAATELVSRLAAGGHDEALALVMEVFELVGRERGHVGGTGGNCGCDGGDRHLGQAHPLRDA